MDEKEQVLKSGDIDYDMTGFILVKPRTSSVLAGPVKVTSKQQYKRLVEAAVICGVHVYSGRVIERDGQFYMIRPYIIDWDTVVDAQQQNVKPVQCPICDSVNVYSRDNIQSMLVHIDTHSRVERRRPRQDRSEPEPQPQPQPEQDQPESLVCDRCGKSCTSKSGLTLHMKSHGVNQ